MPSLPSRVGDGTDVCTLIEQPLFLLSLIGMASQIEIVLTSSENCIRKHFYSKYTASKATSASFLFLLVATFPQFEGSANSYFL